MNMQKHTPSLVTDLNSSLFKMSINPDRTVDFGFWARHRTSNLPVLVSETLWRKIPNRYLLRGNQVFLAIQNAMRVLPTNHQNVMCILEVKRRMKDIAKYAILMQEGAEMVRWLLGRRKFKPSRPQQPVSVDHIHGCLIEMDLYEANINFIGRILISTIQALDLRHLLPHAIMTYLDGLSHTRRICATFFVYQLVSYLTGWKTKNTKARRRLSVVKTLCESLARGFINLGDVEEVISALILLFTFDKVRGDHYRWR
jgi:hypothetical protein